MVGCLLWSIAVARTVTTPGNSRRRGFLDPLPGPPRLGLWAMDYPRCDRVRGGVRARSTTLRAAPSSQVHRPPRRDVPATDRADALVLVGTTAADGRCDVTPRGGPPTSSRCSTDGMSRSHGDRQQAPGLALERCATGAGVCCSSSGAGPRRCASTDAPASRGAGALERLTRSGRRAHRAVVAAEESTRTVRKVHPLSLWDPATWPLPEGAAEAPQR